MKILSVQEIRDALLARDIKLNPPAEPDAIARLERKVGAKLHPYTEALYRSFNGFTDEDFDAKSEIGFWTLEKVLDSDAEYFRDGSIPFADFSLDSEIFLCSAVNPEKPVIASSQNGIFCASLYDFWGNLISGKLDVAERARLLKGMQ